MTRPTLVLVLVFVLGAGCTRAPDKIADTPAPAVPEFDLKSGVLLPETTRQALGLRIADVAEREIGASFQLSLQVYEADEHHARAIGRVAPARLPSLQPGQSIVVSPDANEAVTGSVIRTDDTLQRVHGVGEVLVEIPQPRARFAAGAFITARFALPPGPPVTAIPRSALLESSEGQFVYAVNGERFVRTRVSVGRMNDESVEITDGLYEGDQVVAEPVLSLWMTELAAVKGGQSCCAVSPEEQ